MGGRLGSDLALLWLCCKLVATAPIGPLSLHMPVWPLKKGGGLKVTQLVMSTDGVTWVGPGPLPHHVELERKGTPAGGLGCCQERQAWWGLDCI